MSRRLLLPLLAALALLLAGASAALAVAPAAAGGGPSARIAQDDADDPAADAQDDGDVTDDGCEETDDGEIVCDDDWTDGDVDELCDDDWTDDDDLAGDDDAAEIAGDDDCAEQQDAATAPRVAALHATVTGAGRRARVRVAFRLDRAGKVRLTLERVGASARSSRAGKRCAGTAGTGGGKGRRGCGVALRGSVDVDGRSGANSTELPRRWNGRPLAPGGYRLTATPVRRGGASATTTFSLAAPAAKR